MEKRLIRNVVTLAFGVTFSDAAIMRAKQEAALAKKQAEAAAGGGAAKK